VVNQRFALWWNRRNGSCGQVVMQRMRSPLVQDGRYQLTVMRYGDLNPVRAGLVKRAGHWPWSSFRHYAYGEKNELVTDAAEYVALGSTPAERRKAYLHFFAAEHCADLCGRRPALVVVPFIGDEPWVWRRLAACGLSPPGGTGTHRAG
jgi:putative transposase